MKEELFSFFKFYYYILTGNDKKYKCAVDNQFIITVTPLIFFVLHVVMGVILSISTGNPIMAITTFIHVPSIVGNLLLCNYMNDKYFVIERAKRAEKERQEKIRRFREEYMRKAKEEYERRKKQEEEEARRRAEREWRQYAQWYERKRNRRGKEQYNYQRQHGYYERQYDRQRNEYQYKYKQQQQTTYGGDPQLMDSLKTLGLDRTATKQDIKSAYRKLSRKHHPDVGGKHEDFVRINKAYKYAMDNV